MYFDSVVEDAVFESSLLALESFEVSTEGIVETIRNRVEVFVELTKDVFKQIADGIRSIASKIKKALAMHQADKMSGKLFHANMELNARNGYKLPLNQSDAAFVISLMDNVKFIPNNKGVTDFDTFWFDIEKLRRVVLKVKGNFDRAVRELSSANDPNEIDTAYKTLKEQFKNSKRLLKIVNNIDAKLGNAEKIHRNSKSNAVVP